MNKSIILPNGKKVELWQIRLLGSSAGSVNFLRSIALKAKSGEYKLSEGEYKAYQKVSADEFQKSIKAVQNIIKKKDFFNDDKIQKMLDAGNNEFEIRKAQQKDITKISKDYVGVKKAYDQLVSFYGKDIIDRDPQMRFIGNMEGSFLRQFPDMRKQLQPTLQMALSKVKEKFPVTIDSSVAKEFKGLFAEYDKANRGYSKEKDSGIYPTKEEYETARTKAVGDIEDKIYALAESHKIDDLDPLIIASLRSPGSKLKDLMTAKGKDNLDALIHGELNWTPLEKLKIYDTTVDISPLYRKMSELDMSPKEFGDYINEVMGGQAFSKYFESPRYQLLRSNKLMEVQKNMVEAGIHPEQFKEFVDPIKTGDPEETARVVQKVINISESDAKIVLDLLKESGDTDAAM